jgi:hypothetical protein
MANSISLICLFIVVQLAVLNAVAAVPNDKVPKTIRAFLPEGSFRGGLAGNGFSLLGIKRVFSTDGHSERIIFEIGDKNGKPYSGRPGYFHAQLFRNPSEMSLDLSQLLKTKVSANQLRALLRKSKLIQTADLVSDLEDRSTNVKMRFKVPIKMRVFTLSPKNNSPKLVLDISKQ